MSEFSDSPDFNHVKVVRAVNYATVFPACRQRLYTTVVRARRPFACALEFLS